MHVGLRKTSSAILNEEWPLFPCSGFKGSQMLSHPYSCSQLEASLAWCEDPLS